MNMDNMSVCIVVEREHLEGKAAPDEDPMLSIIRLTAGATKPNHNLLFHGYDDDPREVKDIAECRAFCERIMRECPQFINVVTELTMGVLLYCTDVRMFNGESKINPAWEAVWTKERIAGMYLMPWRKH